VKKRSVLLVAFLLAGLAFAADLQIDNFDDISGWGVYAPGGGGVHQGNAASGDPYVEGTGSLVADYEPGGTADSIYLGKYISPIDLSAQAAAGASVTIRMWVAADTVTARLISMFFETSYLNEFSYTWPLYQTWNTGWNTVTVALADFTATGTADWSDIRQIKMQTGLYPTPPGDAVGDLVLDDWRIIDTLSPLPPTFISDPIDGHYAFKGKTYSGSLADDVLPLDPGVTLAFSKVSGPPWLTVAPDGTLGGTPAAGDVGPNNFRVRVQEGEVSPDPPFSEADLTITVSNTYAGLGQQFRIMPLGDSITTGYTDNPTWNVPFEFGYRSELYTLLTNAEFDFQFVGECPEPWNYPPIPTNTPSPDLRPLGQDKHRGYGGSGITGITGGIVNWLNADNPDVILLMIGINNISYGTNDEPVTQKNDLNDLVNTIFTTKPDVNLIVAQITPISIYSGTLVQYNDYIRDTLVPYYASQGYHVSTVDQYSNFLTDAGDIDGTLYSNGINHPDQTGYQRMAETWFAGLIQLVVPKCNIMDLNDDCEYDLADFAIMAGCWLVDCSADPDDACCDWY